MKKSPIILRYVKHGLQKIVSFIKTIFRVSGKQSKSGIKIVLTRQRNCRAFWQFLSSNQCEDNNVCKSPKQLRQESRFLLTMNQKPKDSPSQSLFDFRFGRGF